MSRIEVTDEQIKAAQAGDSDAMWAVISAHDPLMIGLINIVAPRASAENKEDYHQEARAVFIEHLRDYDTESSPAQLSSVAYKAVRRAIAEADIVASSPVTIEPTAALRVRRAMTANENNVEAAWATFRDATDPTKRMTRELFIAVVDSLAYTQHLDAPANENARDETSVTLAETITDRSTDIADTVERRELALWLMSQIPPRQSLALRAFYGVGMQRQEEAETCDDLHVKPAALRKLRSNGITSARRVALRYDLSA